MYSRTGTCTWERDSTSGSAPSRQPPRCSKPARAFVTRTCSLATSSTRKNSLGGSTKGYVRYVGYDRSVGSSERGFAFLSFLVLLQEEIELTTCSLVAARHL